MAAIPLELSNAIARIPLLARAPRDEIAIEPLPGLTNRNYKITTPGGNYVLRLPGAGTENYIDRAAEAHDAALAAGAGLTPEILYADPATGLMLTRFVDGAETLTAAAMHDPATLRDAAQILRRLHDSGLLFRREMRVFDKIDSYLQKSPRAAAQFGAGSQGGGEAAEPGRRSKSPAGALPHRSDAAQLHPGPRRGWSVHDSISSTGNMRR